MEKNAVAGRPPRNHLSHEILTSLLILLLCPVGIGVLQNGREISPPNLADGVIQQSPGIDGRVIGEDAGFQDFIDGAELDPSSAGGGHSSKRVAAAELRAIKRCRIAVALSVPLHQRVISQRREAGLGGVQRIERNINSGAIDRRSVLAKLQSTGKQEPTGWRAVRSEV